MAGIQVQNMMRTPGQDNDAGLKTILFYARAGEIANWPMSADGNAAATFEDRVSLTGDFEMLPGKHFGKFEITIEKGMLDSNGVGQPGNSSAENILTIFRYGIEKNILGWIETFKNDDLVFIVQDLQGNMRVIGAEGLPAVIMPDWSVKGGDAVSSEKHVQINVKSVGRIAKYYSGMIPLADNAYAGDGGDGVIAL